MAEPEHNGHTTELTPELKPYAVLQTMQKLYTNVLAQITRLGFASRLGSTHSGARDLEEVFGYKPKLRFSDFKQAYLRYDIAKRLVNAFPEESWSQPPVVREDDDLPDETAFEQTWRAMAERLDVYSVLHMADVQAQLGHFAIVLIGLRNQPNFLQPAPPIRNPDDVLFLQAYSEEYARIATFGVNPGAADFALPLTYRLSTGDPFDDYLEKPRSQDLTVHASRVIHIAGQHRLDSELYGLPMLEAVYNKLQDMLKVVGGSAEMFYRDAKRRISVETREGFLMPEGSALEATQTQIEEFVHGLRDVLNLEGMEAKSLAGQVASPKDHFDVLIQAIASACNIPMRVLLGTEEGRMAGDQDQDSWLRACDRRRVQYNERRQLRPLIDRLGLLGALALPAKPYLVDWGKLRNLSETQRAIAAKDYATATQQYEAARVAALQAGLEPTVNRAEFRSIWVALPEVPEIGEPDEPALLLPDEEGTTDESGDETEDLPADPDAA